MGRRLLCLFHVLFTICTCVVKHTLSVQSSERSSGVSRSAAGEGASSVFPQHAVALSRADSNFTLSAL